MAICAFVVSSIELSYYEGLIRQFPPDFLDVYIGEVSRSAQLSLLVTKHISQDYYYTIASLRDLGYHVNIATNEFLNKYAGFVVSANLVANKEIWLDLELLKSKRIMWLFHASDAHIRLMHPVRYVIGPFQRSLEYEDVGKVLKTKEPELFSTMTALPEVRRGEYAFSGPFHIGEWEEKRLKPKSMLREEMCTFLGFDLPDKPVVAFFKDEYCYEPELAKGLRALSNHATIIYKGFKVVEQDPLYQEIHDCVIRWPSTRMAQHLLRFSVDLVLAGFQSGTLTSSAMLTVPVVAYHTNHFKPHSHKSNRIDEFSQNILNGDMVTQQILSHMNILYNIEDSSGIMDFLEMNKEVTFEKSNRNITRLEPVFGDYCISGAAQKTAMLTIRAMSKGSFGKDIYAVKDMSV